MLNKIVANLSFICLEDIKSWVRFRSRHIVNLRYLNTYASSRVRWVRCVRGEVSMTVTVLIYRSYLWFCVCICQWVLSLAQPRHSGIWAQSSNWTCFWINKKVTSSNVESDLKLQINWSLSLFCWNLNCCAFSALAYTKLFSTEANKYENWQLTSTRKSLRIFKPLDSPWGFPTLPGILHSPRVKVHTCKGVCMVYQRICDTRHSIFGF